MSFAFNFASDDDLDESKKDEVCANRDKEHTRERTTSRLIEVLQSKEIIQHSKTDLTSKLKTTTYKFGEHNLTFVDTSKVESLIMKDESLKRFSESKSIVSALSSHSDLVSGVYEGGLKMWECGIDLAQFLSSHPVGQAIEIRGKSVLELGCGAGLPGVYCCCCAAKMVHFQDYNEEVLQLLTCTNVANNTPEGATTQCRYFSGDWSSFSQLLEKENLKYDIILTAETIYNPDNYASLHDVFCKALSDDGVIVVAAKVYYFGVGGSIDAFIDYIEGKKCFTAETVQTIQTGVPRKIIIFRRRGPSR